LTLGGDQLRSARGSSGDELLDRFYDMWRFHYAWSFKGAYHGSHSVANRQSLPGMKEDLEFLRGRAKELRERKKAKR
jgi:hypothetical protein